MSLILIADDDPLVCEVVRNTLAEQGHRVDVVSDGEAAVRLFESRFPDLVILDCAMPGLSGVSVLRHIRAVEGNRTPILMLTARRSSTDEEIASQAGANDYLRKPFSPIQLLVRVELLLASLPRARLSSLAC